MVSVTLSIPKEVKEAMTKFDEVNWSGFIRKCIIEKTKELSWKEEMFKKLEEEKEIIDWSVKLGQIAKKDRFEKLKKKGLL